MAVKAIPFVQARNFTKGRSNKIDVLVIHTMETPENHDTAESVSNWFAGSSAPRASAHYCIDDNSIVQCVHDADVAWHAPGANHNGLGFEHGMKGGIGTAAITLPDGLVVAALVAVNAVGNVVDPATGEFIAGARTDDGRIADMRGLLRKGAPGGGRPMENTTLGVVATNARLTKAQAAKMAQMAHDGFARAIYPSHLTSDGDTIFALSTGTRDGAVDMNHIGALAADAMADAIVRAVRAATGIPGYPAARDLKQP